jgi:hypothetical protein
MSKELAIQALGWMYAEACILADAGTDIRKVEVPTLIARIQRDIPELADDLPEGKDDE